LAVSPIIGSAANIKSLLIFIFFCFVVGFILRERRIAPPSFGL
jgi:hypothetical protein